jgi:hypothetical protein
MKSVVGIIAVIFCFSLCLGCHSETTNNQLSPEPDMTNRYVSSGKTDETSMVQKIYHAIASEPDMGRLVVNLATLGDAASVGLVYKEYSLSHTSEWKVANGYFSGYLEDGRAAYTVEAPFQSYFASVIYCRYAVFAVVGSGESQQTYWDSNAGEDYYYFQPYFEEMLGKANWHFSTEDSTVSISVHTMDFGYEKVYFEYSTDNWASSSEIEATWIAGQLLDDIYEVSIPFSQEDLELSYKLRIEFSENGIVRVDNSGFGYAIGLRKDIAEHTIITIDSQGFNMDGPPLARGGYFRVYYDKTPQCTSRYDGQTWRSVDMGYRFYDDPLFEKIYMRQVLGNPEDSSCTEEWCPATPNTEAVYIPLNAQKVSLWFNHVSSYPPCSVWDSNNGADYNFELE